MAQATKRIRGRILQRTRSRLLRGEPLCRYCLEFGVLRAAVEIDHIVPLHLGGTEDDSNKQPLCKSCHDAKSARERGSVKTGCDVNGIPLDASHPWHISGTVPRGTSTAAMA
jgi:5-methylcytosine-specific restriction endonuclease McrA